MSDAEPADKPPRRGTPPEEVSVGGDPSPLVGALRGLGKVAVAVVVLVAASATVAAVVALLY